MKAISPMIAIVLLVAFTVAIGSILSIWLTGLTQTQAEETGEVAGATIRCAGTSIKLRNITPTLFIVSHESGTENVTNVELTLIVRNVTSNEIYTEGPIACNPINLQPGRSCTADSSALIANDEAINSARASGMCLNTVAISTELNFG